MTGSISAPPLLPPRTVSIVGVPARASVLQHADLAVATAWAEAAWIRVSRVKELRPAFAWLAKHKFTVAWIVWLLQFFTIEGLALKKPESSDDPRTLSRHGWVWFSVLEKGTAWRIRRVALLSLMTWLAVHFVGGGRIV